MNNPVYAVEIKRNAQKALAAIREDYQSKIVWAIKELSQNPRPHGCEKLKGAKDTWRVRVGVYRVVYEIRDDILLVHIVRIDHRKDVYWDY